VALIGACGLALAQEGEKLKTYEMPEVVVTATKSPQTQGNVTQQIDIISTEEIDAAVLGNGNLAEVMARNPGNFSSVLSRNDANWGSSGGLPHKYKSYMLDGLPIDSFVDPQSLDPWAFERIEDQRGSASVLYPNYLFMDFAGNQSPLAGTTNFILKDRVGQPMTRAAVYYGSYNTYGTRVFHQQAAGRLHLFLGGQQEKSDYTDYGTKGSWLNMIDDPQYEKTKLYLRGTYFVKEDPDHKASVYLHRTWHSGDVGRPNRDYHHVYTTVNAEYALPLAERLHAQAKIGYRDYDRTWEEDNYPTNIGLREEGGVKQEIVPADLAVSLSHARNGLLTAGADYQHASYTTSTETTVRSTGNDATASHLGFYAQEEVTLAPFVLRAGARYNHLAHDISLLNGVLPGEPTESWNKLLWSAGARFNQENRLSVYGNLGSSFMAPSLLSVGGTIKLSDRGVAGKDGRLPNPDLKPESGVSGDVGARYQASEALDFGVRGYFTSIDDQILQVVVSNTPSQAQDINAGKTQTYGLEAEVQHRPSSSWRWSANYTYTHTQIDNPEDADQDGADVPFVPQHMANLGVTLLFPHDFTADVWLQWSGMIYDSTSKKGRAEFDGHELVTARLEKRLAFTDGYQLRLYLEPYNLTNNDFEMPWQFQDPGFSTTGGLVVNF
jgi:outer membrane receptor protein involved in Fe transport